MTFSGGYRAMKVVIIPYTLYSALLPQVDRTARMMGAVRDAVGPDVEIMVDFHGRPASASAALVYIGAIEPARPMFVEEVLPRGDSLGLREVDIFARGRSSTDPDRASGQVFAYDLVVEPQTKQASRVAWGFELKTFRSTDVLSLSLMLTISPHAHGG
jgi:hypothetical protein